MTKKRSTQQTVRDIRRATRRHYSAEGRKRFDSFPDVLSDDGYIRGLFSVSEIKRIDDVYSLVKAPKTLLGLIKIKTRSRLGRYELLNKYPSMRHDHNRSYSSAVIGLLKKPMNWPHVVLYFVINVICRLRALYILKKKQDYVWETDTSSRN